MEKLILTAYTRKRKYNSVQTTVDNIKFASKAEAYCYMKLKGLQESKKIKFFLRQVPFHLPGNVKYLCDFVVFDERGVQFVDIKGVETPLFKLKKKQVEALYNVEIQDHYKEEI